MESKKVLIVIGPTASGKSDLAVRVAKQFDGEVISADSRQVYKGLDIGTGKITKRKMRGVPHHLLSVADPRKQFSVAQYKKLAEVEWRFIEARGKLPIIVGGTGFYIDALTNKVQLPNVPPNRKLREKLMKLTNAKLFKMLERKDPKRAKSIDANNKVRLVRALEIVEVLGRVPSPAKGRVGRGQLWVGLKPKDLDKRIEKRVKKMFRQGLRTEIQRLKENGISNKRLKQFGFEYWQPTEEKLIRDTKRYAKRQMTWFKRNPEVRWFSSASLAYAAIRQELEGKRQSQSQSQ